MEDINEEENPSYPIEENNIEQKPVYMDKNTDEIMEIQLDDSNEGEGNPDSLGNSADNENGPDLNHAEDIEIIHAKNDLNLENSTNDADVFTENNSELTLNSNDLTSMHDISSNANFVSEESEMHTSESSDINIASEINENSTICNSGENDINSTISTNNITSTECEENNVNSDSVTEDQQDSTLQTSTENNKRPADEELIDSEPSTKKKASELDLLWVNVNNSPSDFQAWTNLLQHVERTKNLEDGREAYDRFLAHYPFCYGYWKKYVDLEKKKSTEERIMEVFSRGLEAVNLSVDLWIFYLEYVMLKFELDEAFIREKFEKAVDNCGMDFKADRLWEMYVSWESSAERWNRLPSIYDKLISLPLSKYIHHWDKYQELMKNHSLKDLLNHDQFLELRKSVSVDPAMEESTSSEDAPPGVESFSTDAEATECTEEEMKLMLNKFIEEKQKIHNQAAAAAKGRQSFEESIKRPYFHVKPLEKYQLDAWRSYLEFEIKAGDAKRIKTLFGRCLIATALYEEFWMKYIRFLEDEGAPEDEIRQAYTNACTIHLKEKLRPQMSWATFEEQTGNCDGALSILKDLQTTHPECLEPYMMAAAIERRKGKMDLAEQIYIDCLEKFKRGEKKNLHSSVSVKYARFLTYFKGDTEQAIGVINQACEFDHTNLNLLVALVDTAMACRPIEVELAVEALRRGIEAGSTSELRLAFAYRYLHFATEFDSKPGRMNEAIRMVEQIRREIRSSRPSTDVESSSTNESSQSSTTKPAVKSALMPTPVPQTAPSVTHEKHQPAQSPLIPTPPGPGSINGSMPPAAAPSAYGAYQSNPQQQQQQPGYGGAPYNQYPTNYNNASQYPNWNYGAAQPTSYGPYNQQPSWQGYSGYYAGQR